MDRPAADGRTEPEVVGVLLPLALAAPYDYAVPARLDVSPGDFVEVPLGRRRAIGVVWGSGTGGVERGRLRDIARAFDGPPLPAAVRGFVDWIAGYTLAPAGMVLRMAMSVRGAWAESRTAVFWARADAPLPSGLRMTQARKRALDALGDGRVVADAELRRVASLSVLRGLAAAGVLRRLTEPVPDGPAPAFDAARPGPTLTDAQSAAAGTLTAAIDRGFSVTLLDGVTGSGKTEVYFEAIAAAAAAGKQSLVLLPEIAFTAEWIARFEARFGAPPAVWHSELRPAARRRTWRSVIRGETPLVVGARSALLLPFRNLGLIVVDEEHDPGFKQEEGVIYNARDMAVVRGRIGGFPVVLCSATPALETVENVWRGRYGRLDLPLRHGAALLPETRAIDMRTEDMEADSWMSPALCAAVAETLAAGEQTMLFLNRRGYAPLRLCGACGHRLGCPHCTAWLVEHRRVRRLRCHHCGYEAPPPEACPQCGETEKFAAVGPGVERLAEETHRRFPEARLAVMSGDTLGTPSAAADVVRRMHERDIDVLIGTQIMAKGFHFPYLTLVGAVDADLGLGGGDLRAAERTYQTLHQVGGRAGRAERPGRVLIQTWQTEHPVMSALVTGDRDRFVEAEAEARARYRMPPYSRLVALIVHGPNEARVDAAAAELGRTAPYGDGVAVLGPAPAEIPVIRKRHRRRLLLRAPRTVAVQGLLRDWVGGVKRSSGVRIDIDVDPYSFL